VIVRETGGEWWTGDGNYWVRTPDGRLQNPTEESHCCFAGHGSLRLLCRAANGS
jgi:hypothetical protein